MKISKRLIGKPCPICYESMFTAWQWRAYRRVRFWAFVSRLVGSLMPWIHEDDFRIDIGRGWTRIRKK